MNLKHKDIVDGKIYFGIIFFSNFDTPFVLDKGDRRFFVTICNWNKEYTDDIKKKGYFRSIFEHYSNEENLIGLYYYLMNRYIKKIIKVMLSLQRQRNL